MLAVTLTVCAWASAAFAQSLCNLPNQRHFAFTGAAHASTTPTGVTSLQIIARGAQVGDGRCAGSQGNCANRTAVGHGGISAANEAVGAGRCGSGGGGNFYIDGLTSGTVEDSGNSGDGSVTFCYALVIPPPVVPTLGKLLLAVAACPLWTQTVRSGQRRKAMVSTASVMMVSTPKAHSRSACSGSLQV